MVCSRSDMSLVFLCLNQLYPNKFLILKVYQPIFSRRATWTPLTAIQTDNNLGSCTVLCVLFGRYLELISWQSVDRQKHYTENLASDKGLLHEDCTFKFMRPIVKKSSMSAPFKSLDDFLKIDLSVTPVTLSSSFVLQQYTREVVVVAYREIVLW